MAKVTSDNLASATVLILTWLIVDFVGMFFGDPLNLKATTAFGLGVIAMVFVIWLRDRK